MISLSMSIRNAIARQAEAELPNECCGYLAGTRSGGEVAVAKIFPMTNMDRSSEHFSFSPKEQFAATKSARADGLELVASYHSHPETPARMSEEDIRLAYDTSILYLIHSVTESSLKAFAIDISRTVSEAHLVITD